MVPIATSLLCLPSLFFLWSLTSWFLYIICTQQWSQNFSMIYKCIFFSILWNLIKVRHETITNSIFGYIMSRIKKKKRNIKHFLKNSVSVYIAHFQHVFLLCLDISYITICINTIVKCRTMENLLRLDSGGEFRWDRKVWIMSMLQLIYFS